MHGRIKHVVNNEITVSLRLEHTLNETSAVSNVDKVIFYDEDSLCCNDNLIQFVVMENYGQTILVHGM